jgi:hypothetical protein
MEYNRIKNLYYTIKTGCSPIQAILFFFIFFTLFSCSTLNKIGIEVAVQPEYPISEDIQSLALLNRSMTSQFTNIKVDSLEKILINNKMLLDAVFQDSIAADTTIQVAARALFDSGRFDVVVPKERNIVRTDTNVIVNPINITFINEICRNFKVDAVLILEMFAERLDTKYYLNTLYEPNEYSAATDIAYFSEWRLYRPDNRKQVIRFQVGDSIFWKATGLSVEDVYQQMPRTKEAIIGGGIASGLKMSGYISPNWVNQTRYYYATGKDEIDAAIPLIKNNKWEEAAPIWTKYEPAYSGTIKSKIQFNLALAAEMNGDIDLAIEWGLKSFKTRYTKTIEVYLKTLEKIRTAKQKENQKSY